MPSPFPGMDPYLEDPAFWRDFHAAFIYVLCDTLRDKLPENYDSRIDERETVLDETFIKILRRPGQKLVSLIELLSPSNKEQPGRSKYLEKRDALLREEVNLIEIDLLRAGQRMPLAKPWPAGDYFVLVARPDERPDCQIYGWTTRDPLPTVPIPLERPDADVVIDLADVFTRVYDRGRYARTEIYTYNPSARNAEESAWFRERLGAAPTCR